MKLKLNQLNFTPRTICEVGTGGSTCVLQCEDLLHLESNFIFVEANPLSFAIIKENFGDKDNFKLYNVAVADENRKGTYYTQRANEEDASGYIDGINSSAMVKGLGSRFSNAIEVDFIKFSEIDDGTIDLLIADIEGAEYFLLKHLVSRPKLIVLEIAFQDKLTEINDWMKQNDYTQIAVVEEDGLFARNY